MDPKLFEQFMAYQESVGGISANGRIPLECRYFNAPSGCRNPDCKFIHVRSQKTSAGPAKTYEKTSVAKTSVAKTSVAKTSVGPAKTSVGPAKTYEKTSVIKPSAGHEMNSDEITQVIWDIEKTLQKLSSEHQKVQQSILKGLYSDLETAKRREVAKANDQARKNAPVRPPPPQIKTSDEKRNEELKREILKAENAALEKKLAALLGSK